MLQSARQLVFIVALLVVGATTVFCQEKTITNAPSEPISVVVRSFPGLEPAAIGGEEIALVSGGVDVFRVKFLSLTVASGGKKWFLKHLLSTDEQSCFLVRSDQAVGGVRPFNDDASTHPIALASLGESSTNEVYVPFIKVTQSKRVIAMLVRKDEVDQMAVEARGERELVLTRVLKARPLTARNSILFSYKILPSSFLLSVSQESVRHEGGLASPIGEVNSAFFRLEFPVCYECKKNEDKP